MHSFTNQYMIDSHKLLKSKEKATQKVLRQCSCPGHGTVAGKCLPEATIEITDTWEAVLSSLVHSPALPPTRLSSES